MDTTFVPKRDGPPIRTMRADDAPAPVACRSPRPPPLRRPRCSSAGLRDLPRRPCGSDTRSRPRAGLDEGGQLPRHGGGRWPWTEEFTRWPGAREGPAPPPTAELPETCSQRLCKAPPRSPGSVLGHLWLPASVPGAASTPPEGLRRGACSHRGPCTPTAAGAALPRRGPSRWGR